MPAIRPKDLNNNDLFPKFAANDYVDPVSKQNNVVEPPDAVKTQGWPYRAKGVRQWFNWLHRLTYQWLVYAIEKLDGYDASINNLNATFNTFNGNLTTFTNRLNAVETVTQSANNVATLNNTSIPAMVLATATNAGNITTITNTTIPAINTQVNNHTSQITTINNTLISGVTTLANFRLNYFPATNFPARTLILVSGIPAGTSGVPGGGICLLYNDSINWRSVVNGTIIT
jgi:hypothetical protein